MKFESNPYGGFRAVAETDEDHAKLERVRRTHAILNCLENSVSQAVKYVKELPVSDKRKTAFKKNYNRRPMRTQKRVIIFCKMAISNAITAANIYQIQTQPIPRFKKGSPT